MPDYRLIVTDENGGRTIPISQETVDDSPALKAILDRSFVQAREGSFQKGFDQSYNESTKHDNHHDNHAVDPGTGYTKSYTRTGV